MALGPAAFVDTLARLFPQPVSLHEPEFGGREWQYVKECLDSGWVSSAGPFVERFEHALAAATGARHAIATVNGTASLHVCLRLAGVRSGEEVLIPTLTFVATANAVSYCGAIPHFVDADPRTLGIDPAALERHLDRISTPSAQGPVNRETGRRIAAVVAMHTFGHPVNLDALLDVCARHRLTLVEDAAESLGSTYKGRHTGTFGLVAALSFNGNKIATTGGGGAILTNDDATAQRARHLTTTAKLPHQWEFVHDEVGYNYRLPNLNAALGCAQLEQLASFVERKRHLAETYRATFAGFTGLTFVSEPAGTRSNYWLNAILLDPAEAHLRDDLLAGAHARGIKVRPVWRPMHLLDMYAACPRMRLDVAEDIARRLINLPSSPRLVERLHAAA